eukprot:Platyproteum_vivax@DN2493_c0_g1_i2.p1
MAGASNVSNPAKLFIGNIPFHTTEEQIRAECDKCGTVETIFYQPGEKDSTNFGWCFVSFSNRAEAINGINHMDGQIIFETTHPNRRPLEVRFCDQKPIVTQLTGTAHAEQQPAAAPSQWSEYFSKDGVPYYHNAVTNVTQWERPLEDIPSAQTQGSGSGGNMGTGMAGGANSSAFGPPGSNLFVFHLPSEWGEMDLIQNFQSFGHILSARIQRDHTGRARGFGFVSFDNPHSAAHAIHTMNGFHVGGKWLKVQLKKGEEHLSLTSAAFTSAQMNLNPNPMNAPNLNMEKRVGNPQNMAMQGMSGPHVTAARSRQGYGMPTQPNYYPNMGQNKMVHGYEAAMLHLQIGGGRGGMPDAYNYREGPIGPGGEICQNSGGNVPNAMRQQNTGPMMPQYGGSMEDNMMPLM